MDPHVKESDETAPPRPGEKLRPGDEILVRVEGVASDGRATAGWGERALKIEGAVPGETVRARVFGRDKRTFLARAVEAVEPSPHRIEPRCRHFGECGGCSWQHISYAHQLELKRQLLLAALAERGLEHPPVPLPLGVEGEPYLYRNKMDFDFGAGPGGAVHLGLHRRGSYRTLLDLHECHLQSPHTAPVLASARRLAAELALEPYDLRTHQGLLRNLLLLESKHSGQLLAQIVTAPLPHELQPRLQAMGEALLAAHPELAGVLHAVHEGRSNVANPDAGSELLAGAPTLRERLAGLELEVGPRTFLQRNTAQAARLYATVIEFAAPQPDQDAIDLYCGFGPISQLLAPHVRSVTGIEVVPEMIDEAARLARERGVQGARFLLGTAEQLLPQLAAELRPALVVANPPRVGIHRKALRALAELGAPRLVYVSCSPASLADNLCELLGAGYRLEQIQPVDMFPQTPHLETVVALGR